MFWFGVNVKNRGSIAFKFLVDVFGIIPGNVPLSNIEACPLGL